MGARAALVRSIDALAGEVGSLTFEAAHRPSSPDITTAIERARDAFAAADRFLGHLHDDDLDNTDTRLGVWQAIAVAQDQIRRAQALVAAAWVLCEQTAELKRTAAEIRAESRAWRAARRARSRER